MSDVLTRRPEEDAASPNGKVEDPFEAKLLADLDGAIREARERVARLEPELVEARAKLKRYEDTRKRLVGEPLINHPGARRRGRPPAGERGDRPAHTFKPEKLAEIGAFVREYAEHHEEFRQVDIRSAPGSPIVDSGKLSTAFEALRQANVIRLARQDGNSKVYRLTRSAINEGTK